MGDFFNDPALFVKLAGIHRRVVIKGEPGIFPETYGFIFFFERNDIHGKVVIGHNPQGLEMHVGGQQVCKVVGYSFFRLDSDNLVSPGVTCCMLHLNSLADFKITFNKLQVVSIF